MQPSDARSPQLDLVLDYLKALEDGAEEARLASFFTPDVEQREYPNRLVERGVARDLEALLAASRKGRNLLENQRYVVKNALVEGDRVALEVSWSARLLVPLGSLAAGDWMTAESGMFFWLRDGRVFRQHNFDCFAPF